MRRWTGFGLGQTNVGPLAQAQFTGQINPTFLPPQSFQPSYMPAGETSTLPTDLYMDSGSATQIAALLGGSVIQAPPPGNYQGTGIPLANWIQVSDGVFDPGLLFPPGEILSYPDECSVEQALVSEIPGGQLSPTCASGATGLTPTQMALQNDTSLTPAEEHAAANDIVGGSANMPPTTAPPSLPAPVISSSPTVPAGLNVVQYPTQVSGSPLLPAQPTAPSQPPPPSQVVSGTAGSNVGGSNAGSPQSPSSGNAILGQSCVNPINGLFPSVPDPCWGPLGMIEWLLIGAAALLLLAGSGKR